MQVNQASEPLYIVKPFHGGGLASLFSTHPQNGDRLHKTQEEINKILPNKPE